MIVLAADVHGSVHFNRLKDNPLLKTLRSSDYFIVCGDFGIVWDPPATIQVIKAWADAQVFSILFIDGNHEHFPLLNRYPISHWHGGKVHQISKNVIHLLRGQVFQLDGMKFFTFGGGFSIKRITGQSPIQMFPEEMPTPLEYDEGLNTLKTNDFTIDFVLTHTAPTKWLREIGEKSNQYEQELNDYLDRIEEKLKYHHWYFGHFHKDQHTEKYTIIYEKMICLEGDLHER
jgi:hypothetical protein